MPILNAPAIRFLPLCSALLIGGCTQATPPVNQAAPSATPQSVASNQSQPGVTEAPASQTYRNIRGQVKAVTAATAADPQAVVSVAHETIPDFMEAMSMRLPLKNAQDAKRIKQGDKISFDLALLGGTPYIENIKLLPASTKLKLAKS